MPKSYPLEFKARSLALLKARRSIQHVALELELSEATDLHLAYAGREIDSGTRPGRSSPQADELAAARRRIRELEEEVLIPNKAAQRWKPVVPPKDRLALIGELASQGVSIERASRLLEVSRRATSPGAAGRPPNARSGTRG